MKRDLVSIRDLSGREIGEIFDLALDLKARSKRGEPHRLLEGKTLAMIFEKPSLRTRVTFETGMFELGGHAIYLAPADIGLGKRESVHDAAKCLSRWCDLIMARTFAHRTVEELALHAECPVINGLSDLEHPCQVLADCFTLKERWGELKGRRIAWVGDGFNVCHSLILISAKLGLHLNVATPRDYEPKPEILEVARADAQSTGAQIRLTNDPAEAVGDAEAVYTDIWASMGHEQEAEQRRRDFRGFQVNRRLMAKAPPGALVMHDLPAHRGEEITDEIIDGPNSIVFDQAENRLHTQKAIMVFLAGRRGA